LSVFYRPALGRIGSFDISTAAAAGAGVALYAILSGHVVPPRDLRASMLKGLVLKTAFFAITAAAEEIIWRGVAFTYLGRQEGVVAALVITTVAFAAIHVYNQGWGGFVTHLVTGLAFGLALVSSGKLVDAIAMHVSYNIAVTLMGTVRADGTLGRARGS
jgi:membrane protease YdiL (CAAX protease family)